MSRQKGIIKLVGNIGGMSFYTSNGEYLARTAGGPTKEQISNGPNFVRTRENNKEFGGSAKVGKSLRTALSGVVQTMGGSNLASRLTAVFKSINSRATGIRGQRPIALTTSKEMLRGLELNDKVSFTSVFNAPYEVDTNAERTEVSVTIPEFIPMNFIKAPAGATKFRMVLACGLVSDYNYDDSTRNYEPDNPSQNALGSTSAGAVTELGNTPATFSLMASVPNKIEPDSDVSVVTCLGIEFYQEVSGTDYLLAQGNTMQIIGVF
ncbi:MAG: hypothetical protein E2590_08540 [Chryseobacterium sp.]|nr:hypothetical protein [Chryseobacterium sp.]